MKVYNVCIQCHKANISGEKAWKRYENLGNLADVNDVGFVIGCPRCKKKAQKEIVDAVMRPNVLLGLVRPKTSRLVPSNHRRNGSSHRGMF